MGYSFLHRKERIILTTIDVINEYGIQGISTREVAKRQGITEAAVFKHFPRKVDLLNAVLDFYAQYDKDISMSSLQQKDYLQAIFYFVTRYAEYYETTRKLRQLPNRMTCWPVELISVRKLKRSISGA